MSQEESLGGDIYVYGLDDDDVFTGVYLTLNHGVVYIKFVHFFLSVNHTSVKWCKSAYLIELCEKLNQALTPCIHVTPLVANLLCTVTSIYQMQS